MALHVGLDYFSGLTPLTGKSLVYRVQRNALAPGVTSPQPAPPFVFDHQSNQFSQTPVIPDLALVAGQGVTPQQFYSDVRPTTPSTIFYDGEYQILITDITSTPFPVRTLYLEMVNGDDGMTGFYNQQGPVNGMPTYLDRIIKDVRQYVQDVLSSIYTAPNVQVSIHRDYFPTAGASSARIRPGSYQANNDQVTGGGRLTTGQMGQFWIAIQHQRLTDITQQDYYRLVGMGQPGTPMLRIIEQTVSALQLYFPVDAAGNVLTQEPVRVVGNPQPILDEKDPEQLAGVELPIECRYTEAMPGG
jgi:hypothetical protein